MDDLISRQAAIEAVERNACNTQRAIDAINGLPSAQPERKTGRWITHLYKLGKDRYECDSCHKRCDTEYCYCPHCGAKMEGRKVADEDDS